MSATTRAVPLAPGGPGSGCTSSAFMLATNPTGLAWAGPATKTGATSASGSSNRSVRIAAMLERQEELGEVGHLLIGEPEVEADGAVEGKHVVEQRPPGHRCSVGADGPVEGMAPGPARQEVTGSRGVTAAAVVEVRRGEPQAEQRRRVEPEDRAVGGHLAR